MRSFILQNNLRLEDTFLTVNRFVDNVWTPVRSDSHPSTIYAWEQTNTVSFFTLGCSLVALIVCIDTLDASCIADEREQYCKYNVVCP